MSARGRTDVSLLKSVMLCLPLALIIGSAATAALGAEPQGCDKFKWPLDKEKALLAKPVSVASGGTATLATGEALALAPLAEAKLPHSPSRPPKYPDSYAGFLQFAAPPHAGSYRVTLTHGAWIDVVQDGRVLRPTDHSGARGCTGLAKSVKFDLSTAPFVVEISATSAHNIDLAVTAD